MSFLIKGTVVGYSKSFFGRAGFLGWVALNYCVETTDPFPPLALLPFFEPFLVFYSVWMDALLQVQVDFDATDV